MLYRVGAEKKIFRIFIVSIAFTIALFVSGVCLGAALYARNLIQSELMARGRAHFRTIAVTRKWNASYGGVYVLKTKGVESNPYLENPDIEAADGRMLTLRNPALMTKEISGFASMIDLFTFHITSLRPVNPENAPDEFEADALSSFDAGTEEAFQKTVINGIAHFRYMAPLMVEPNCLQCHEKHGYKLGDIRGGISVTFNIDYIEKKLRENLYFIIGFGGSSAFLLLWLLVCFTIKLGERISDSRKLIESLAMTDGLTGIFNRRYALDRFTEEFRRAKRIGKPLGCIMLDLDNFKAINDTYGHLVGDAVLRDFTAFVKGFLRSYDVLGRYGGEEFLIVLSDSDLEKTRQTAERLRADVETLLRISSKTGDIRLTVSCGVSELRPDDESIDNLLQRADNALYRAKEGGRNKVEAV